MSKILIVTDSASDISYEDEKQYQIRMLPFTVVVDGKSYVSRVDFDNEKYYALMAQSKELPTTSQITAFEFMEQYRSFAAEGYTDAILILINGKGSATYENAQQAVRMLQEDYPDTHIRLHIINSRSYSAAYGHAVVRAGQMAQEGKSVEEILQWVNNWIDHVMIYVGIYGLKYAAKSGRIPTAAAFVGDAIGMKPIMKIWDQHIVTAGKVRGEKNLIPGVVRMTVTKMTPGSEYCIIGGQGTEDVQHLAAAMTEAVGYPPVGVYQIGAAVATNIGPRVAATVFQQEQTVEK